MAKVRTMNENGKEVVKVLKELENGKGFAKDVLAVMLERGSKRTFNSVNATLASLEKLGYTTKRKAVCGEKFLTEYTITEKAIKELESATE